MKKAISFIFFPIVWLFKRLSDGIYALKVLLHKIIRKRWQPKPSTIKKDKVFDFIFYCCFLAIPLTMFIITNFVINGTSIVLSFREIDPVTDKYIGVGFQHYRDLFEYLARPTIGAMFERSLIVWALSTVFCNIFPITFTFYVYKKFPGHAVFRTLLFLPTLFSSMITVSLFKMICNRVIPEIFGGEALITMSGDKTFGTLLFYQIWSGLGGSMLTGLAIMRGIDPSINESGQIDGVGFYGELWYLVLPNCYRILTLGLATSWVNIFGNTLHLFPFVGMSEPESANVLGHHFYVKQLKAVTEHEYGLLAAYGMFQTLICAPLTLTTRHFINKFGPSED